MSRTCLMIAMMALVGCKTEPTSLSLSFGAYSTMPVVLTHFSIEMPLAPTPAFIPSGRADQGVPRMAGSASGNAPVDAGNDGIWLVSARWVELLTDRAYEASVEVPIAEVSVDIGMYTLNPIMGPNGLFIVGSDLAGIKESDLKDIVQVCGERVPSDDKAWRLATDVLPGVAFTMNYPRGPVTNPECPAPKE